MLDSLISAGANLIQGFLNKKASDKNIALQKEFAQSGIQWKVQDAQKAGIHPLYALGANTTSFSPVAVGDNSISAAGQDIGRAVRSSMPQERGATALAAELAKAQLDGVRVDNDIKRAELASRLAKGTAAGSVPGIPGADQRWFVDGQGNSGLPGQGNQYERKIDPPEPGQPNAAAGASPEVSFYRTPTGWAPMIPQSLSESFEADWLSKWQWLARNKLLPQSMGGNFDPPKNIKLPVGMKWDYNAALGEYRMVPRDNHGYKWRR